MKMLLAALCVIVKAKKQHTDSSSEKMLDKLRSFHAMK
jgi:hypothetical protein